MVDNDENKNAFNFEISKQIKQQIEEKQNYMKPPPPPHTHIFLNKPFPP